MNSLFNLVIRVMNRLSYLRKIGVIAGIGVIVVSILFYALFQQLNKSIIDSQLQLQGIERLVSVNKTIQFAQQYRGLSSATWSGKNPMLEEQYDRIEKEIELSLITVMASFPSNFILKTGNTDVSHLYNTFLDLKSNHNKTSLEADFAEHTNLITQLQLLSKLIAEHYLLITDSELTTYYLIDSLVNNIPRILESMGRVRGIVTGVLTEGKLSGLQREQLVRLDAMIEQSFIHFEFNLSSIKRHSPKLTETVDTNYKIFYENKSFMSEFVKTEILMDKFSFSPEQFLVDATTKIDLIYSLMYQHLVPILHVHIEGRINAKQTVLTNVTWVAGILMLFIMFLMAGLYKSLINNIYHISQVIYDYSQGNLNARIKLTTQDELREISVAVNTMADTVNKVRAEIAQEKERFRILFEKSGNGIAIIENGVFVDCNEKSLSMMGYDLKADLLTSPAELSPEYQADGCLSSEKAQEMMAQCIENGSHNFEWLHEKKDGTSFWVDILLTRLEYQGKQQIHVVWRDIAQIKELESGRLSALHEAEFMRRVIESSLNEIYIFDVDTLIFRSVNLGARNNLGYTSEELSVMTTFDIKPEFTEDKFRLTVEPLRSGIKKKLTFFTVHQRKDGTTYPVEVHLQLLDDQINPAYVAISLDITERNAKEQRLIRSEERLANAQMTAHLGSWDFDIINNTLEWSDEIFRIFEYEKDLEPSYEHFLSCIPEEDRNRVGEAYRHSVESGIDYSVEHRVIMKDGREKFVHEQGQTKYDEKGTAVHSFGSVLDITERKQQEIKLIALKKEAEEANKAKSEFLSSMSHELRTPLNAILGFAQLLESDDESPLNEEQKKSLCYILSGGYHLLDLVNDVLELARIDAGIVNVAIESVELVEIIEDVSLLISAIASKFKIQFQIDSNKKIMISADRIRFKQVLINLLNNAIKYNTKNGSVTISWAETDHRTVKINIIDTGIGIPTDQHKKVFDAFNRLGQENSTIEGTGIGLVVTKDLVELMHGTIGFKSVEGQGSTFWIELPLAETVEIEEIVEIIETVETESKHILYVEDNLANRRLMQSIFDRLPHSLEMVENAELGQERALEDDFDLILIDINLPGMDGKELTQRLRKTKRYKSKPIVAVTSAAMEYDIEVAKGLFDDYVTKPIDLSLFLNILAKSLKAS